MDYGTIVCSYDCLFEYVAETGYNKRNIQTMERGNFKETFSKGDKLIG